MSLAPPLCSPKGPLAGLGRLPLCSGPILGYLSGRISIRKPPTHTPPAAAINSQGSITSVWGEGRVCGRRSPRNERGGHPIASPL